MPVLLGSFSGFRVSMVVKELMIGQFPVPLLSNALIEGCHKASYDILAFQHFCVFWQSVTTHTPRQVNAFFL